ncbi:MAG: hypothetical protein L7W42_07745 [Alphaproteobacteria bacterium]|nr:hypothetical protein [Alphaproteobacteria bacterium]
MDSAAPLKDRPIKALQPGIFRPGHKPQFWDKFAPVCGMRANAGKTDIILGYSAIFAGLKKWWA